MNRRRALGSFLSALACAAFSRARAAEAPLELALAPYISTRALLTLFQPLSSHLERHLSRPVLPVTAPSLREFDQRLLSGAYDLAMASPQAARLAQLDAGYAPLLRVTNDMYGLVLVQRDSGVRAMRDLAGARIALPDRFTTAAALGQELLRSEGLDGASVLHPPGFQDSILLSLVRGEFDAMVMNGSAFHQTGAKMKGEVRILGETRRISHVMFVARRDMPAATRQAVQEGIAEFWGATPEGKRFRAQSGLEGVRPPTDAELRALDGIAGAHRRLLQEVAR
jgi:phosphonate transport system substrate-binding protein